MSYPATLNHLMNLCFTRTHDQALKPQVDALQARLDKQNKQITTMKSAAAASVSAPKSFIDGEEEQPQTASAQSDQDLFGAGSLASAPKRRTTVKSAAAKAVGTVAPKDPKAPRAK